MSLNEWLLNKPRKKSSSREMEIDKIIKNLNDRKISNEKKNFILLLMRQNSLKDNHDEYRNIG